MRNSAGRILDPFQSGSQAGLQVAFANDPSCNPSSNSHQQHHHNQNHNSQQQQAKDQEQNLKGSSSAGDPARSLPTPEMSPVEQGEKEMYHHHQQQQHQQGQLVRFANPSTPNAMQGHRGFGENPVSQLISRFSESSSFLRNVCPPYRRPPLPGNGEYHSMDQIPSVHLQANFEYQVPAHLGAHELHWSHGHYVQQGDQQNGYAYDKHELKSEGYPDSSDAHLSQQQQHQMMYEQQQQYLHAEQQQQQLHQSSGEYDGGEMLGGMQQHAEQGDFERIMSGAGGHEQLGQHGGHLQAHLLQQHHQQGLQQQQQHFSHLAQKLTEFRPAPGQLVCDNNNGSAELMAALAETREIIS